MKIGTFLWGIVISLCGVIAILQGSRTQLDPSTLIVVLLLIFAGACTIAALVPARRQTEPSEVSINNLRSDEDTNQSVATATFEAPQRFENSPSLNQADRFEVEPSAEPPYES